MNVGKIGFIEPVGVAFRAARLLAASFAGFGQVEGLKLLSGVVQPHPMAQHRTGQNQQEACPTVTPVGDRRSDRRRQQQRAVKTKRRNEEK